MATRLRLSVILLGIILGSGGLSIAGVQLLPFLNLAEQWLSDFRISSLSPPEDQNQDIIILTVTEDTLSQFPYRSPLDRQFLTDTLFVLEQRDVRAIGIDILFDQPSELQKDQALRNMLHSMKTPLVVAYARSEEGLNKAQQRYIDDFISPELRGFINLIKDGLSHTVRWIYPGREIPDDLLVRGFPGALSEKLGVLPPDEEAPIFWRPSPSEKEKSTFRAFPIHTLKFLPAAWFKDKIILIGSDLPLSDRHRTPFVTSRGIDGVIPGIVIHAHALSQLLANRPSVYISATNQALIIIAASMIGVAMAFIEVNLIGRMALTFISAVIILIGGLASFQSGYPLFPIVGPIIALVFGIWMTDAFRRNHERQQRKYLKNAFSLYLSPDLVERVITNPDALALGGEYREMSYIFTDIAGFTSLSERAGPKAVSSLLNKYLGGVCDIAFRHGGTVTDFIGDAVFIMFNAPLDQQDHARRALTCALEIDGFSEQFRQEKVPRELGLGITRIGVHTGAAAVGNMGADIHFKYSPIGDAVNTASRIEGLNKHFGTRICASGNVLEHYPDAMARPMGRVIMKGKEEPLEIYELLAPDRAESPFMSEYRRAYSLLDAGDGTAETLFEKLHLENPEDGCVALLLDQINRGNISTQIIMSDK